MTYAYQNPSPEDFLRGVQQHTTPSAICRVATSIGFGGGLPVLGSRGCMVPRSLLCPCLLPASRHRHRLGLGYILYRMSSHVSCLIELIAHCSLQFPRCVIQIKNKTKEAGEPLSSTSRPLAVCFSYGLSLDILRFSTQNVLGARGKGGAELPLPALRRRRRGRWARGWVGDPGARSRTPPTSAPFAEQVGSKT
jgi:hypothetical protein